MSASFNFLLFILPFIFLPSQNFQFEIPKVILGELAIGILATIFFLKNKVVKIRLNQHLLVLDGLIIAITLIDLVFLSSSISFFGNQFRMQGIFLLWMLVLLSFISSLFKYEIPKTKWLVLLLTLELLVGLLIGWSADGRLVGTLGEPNMLASFITFLSTLIIFNSDKETSYIKITGIILAALIIFLTGSRSGAVAFIIVLISYFLIEFRKLSLKKTLIIALFLTLLSLGLPFIDKTTSLLEDRIEIWRVSILAGTNNPILGSGFGNTETSIHNEAVKINSPIQYIYIDSSHNLILDWWIEGGIIGVIAILSVISFTIYNFFNKKNSKYLFSFLVVVTTMLFNPTSIITLITFWWLIGVSFQS